MSSELKFACGRREIIFAKLKYFNSVCNFCFVFSARDLFLFLDYCACFLVVTVN